MFNRGRNIPVRFWITIGLIAGMAAAVALSARSLMSDSGDESPMSAIEAHNADLDEVMSMLRD